LSATFLLSLFNIEIDWLLLFVITFLRSRAKQHPSKNISTIEGESMRLTRHSTFRATLVITLMLIITISSTQLKADTGSCGGATTTLPFTDVPGTNTFFCAIAEAYFSGLTNGTTATTYSPNDPVPREQMAAFVTRTQDQSVKRASKRAALQQFWTVQDESNLGYTTVGLNPQLVQSDGADLWVANRSGTVSRVRGSDGKLLETWTGAANAFGVLCAMGKVFITGSEPPGKLYQIDPTQPAGAVTTLTSSLGNNPQGIAFDGQRIWTANPGGEFFTSSVSIVTLNPLSVTNVTTGFILPSGILYDGANIWVADYGDSAIKKLDSSGNILLSVNVGCCPQFPAFDGTNIWVPKIVSGVAVVRATGALSGTVLANLTGNGLDEPYQAAFDGERILVTNQTGNTINVSLSLWRASDLTPIGMIPMGRRSSSGVCSDGLNFWIAFTNPDRLGRF
jgi:S-layer family protein